MMDFDPGYSRIGRDTDLGFEVFTKLVATICLAGAWVAGNG